MSGNRTIPAVVGRRASLRFEGFGVSYTLRRRPRVKPPESVRGGKRGGERRASELRLDKLPKGR